MHVQTDLTLRRKRTDRNSFRSASSFPGKGIVSSNILTMAFESSRKGDLDDGVSELEDIAKVSFSCNLEFEPNNKQNQNLAVGKRDVNGYKSDSPPPAEQGSLKIVGSLLSNLKLEDESSVLSSHDKNGFMSENDIQALSANSYDRNRPLTRMTGEENQMVAQRFQSGLYDSQCQSLFSIPPGHHFYQSTNNSSELQDSQRERLRHPVSMSPDQPADDLARILNGGHGASADLLQEDDELRSKSSTSSSLFHHASQTFSDQFLNAPETACLGTSTFSGQETTPFVASRAGTSQRETHGTMPIYNASDALENMWRSKTHEVQPISRPSSTSNLPLEGSQVFCNASSGTADISDIGVTASDISQDHPIRSQIHSGANYPSSGQFDMPSHPNSTWENQLINIYLSNVNIPKINNGYESDSLISGIGRPEALLNGISYDTALNSDRKSSGFPPVEASKMQRLDFLCHAVSQYEKHPHGGEGLANDIERTTIQGRSLFQSQEMQMTYLHDNTAAAGLNVHPLRTDFKMTSGNFMGLQRAYLEQTLLAQQIQQHESYLSNFINECQRNPSYGIGLHYGEHPMGNSMTHSVNGSRNHILHNRRVSHSRNGTWHPDAAAKSGGRLQTSFLEEMKINKIYCFGLPDIVGHVAEFSSDQRGSRLIQKKLEIASEEHKNLIFPEISLHARELMTDVFGNYVIQKFLECGTTSQRRELVDQISGRVLILSLHMYGCRVIQKTLDVADVDQTTKIVAELGGAVIKCVHDQNGNHVIQKCIESIPENRIQSIMTTFYGQVAALSTHPYGCRVIQRVLEHCADQKSREMVFREILESVIMLAQNQYGNYVVQRLLLHGKPHERSAIIRKLVGHIVSMSQQKYASNVIEMCLENCSPHDRQLLVNEVLLRSAGEMEPLQVMMQDQYGNYVVQKILKTCTDKDLAPILSRIKLHLKSLNKYPYGKNIVSRIEKLVATGERRIALSSLYK